MSLSIQAFEELVQTRRHGQAGQMLLEILSQIDVNSGQFSGIEVQYPQRFNQQQCDEYFCIRMANAIAQLFADPDFNLSPQGFQYFMVFQSVLSVIFGVTEQRNGDSVIRVICGVAQDQQNVSIPETHLHKSLALMTIESQLSIDLDAVWSANPVLFGHIVFAWLATKVVMSPAAHQKREILLAGMPLKLQALIDRADGLEIFSQWPLLLVNQVYMLCSYGFLNERHQIKRQLNVLLRKYLLAHGLQDVPARVKIRAKSAKTMNAKAATTRAKVLKTLSGDSQTAKTNNKPVLMVITEWFSPGFAVYRTHSETLRAMRDKFHLIGVGPKVGADAIGQAVFHEFFETPTRQDNAELLAEVRFIAELAHKMQPDMVYYLGVGMFAHTIWGSNLRLAPIQLVSNGHGASTFSPIIDYFMTDGGYISGPDAFGEADVLPMPAGVMAMVANKDIPIGLDQRSTRVPREHPSVVRIAIAAAVIKMNPVFINLLKQIADISPTPVEFHFPMAQAVAGYYIRVKTEIEAILGRRGFVYTHQMYPQYLDIIAQCDMFINPFPYGNTNGIADMALLGMPGVCKAGPELAEHIDVGMFRTLGMPEWTICWTHEDYANAILRMINNHDERTAIARQLIDGYAFSKLSANQCPEVMGEILRKLVDA